MWKQQVGKSFLVASKVGEVFLRRKLQLTDYVHPNFFFMDKLGGITLIIKNTNILEMEEVK